MRQLDFLFGAARVGRRILSVVARAGDERRQPIAGVSDASRVAYAAVAFEPLAMNSAASTPVTTDLVRPPI